MEEKYREISSDTLEAVDCASVAKTVEKELSLISFSLRNVSINSGFNIHHTKLILLRKKPLNDDIQLDLSESKEIIGTIDEDSLYPSVFSSLFSLLKKEGDFLIAREWSRTIIVRITSGKLNDSHGFLWSGKYPGKIIASSDSLEFHVKIPEEHFSTLIKLIENKPDSQLHIGLSLFAFTIDCYLNNKILIDKSALCFINYISLVSHIGVHLVDENNLNQKSYQNTTYEKIALFGIFKQLRLNNRLLILLGLICSFFLIKSLHKFLL